MTIAPDPLPDLPPGMDVYGTDLFIPDYRLAGQGQWSLRRTPLSISQGYWSPARLVRDLVVLLRAGVTWMSTAPLELESQEIGIRLARGHVVIFGMGMGWCAVNCALREEVTRVTVVELDPDILELHRELNLAAQLPAAARTKLHVVQGDAYDYVPDAHVDLLMPDIWQPLVSDGRVEEVRRMQANVRADHIYFWGQELEIARHAVAAGRLLDDEGIRRTVDGFDLALIGLDVPGHAEKLRIAAHRFMQGRWLTGPPPPDFSEI